VAPRSGTRFAIKVYANLLLFCTLTGMRGSECVESIRLLNSGCHGGQQQYYSPQLQILQHYLFPQIFIRRTKAIYISVVNDEIIGIAQNIGQTPTLAGLKKAISVRKLSMHIKYCRKIHASWLHKKGISSDLIDVLQGRISRNIFLRHYLTPDNSFKNKVLDAVSELQRQLY
jgi:Archaeal phage integrase